MSTPNVPLRHLVRKRKAKNDVIVELKMGNISYWLSNE